MQKASRSAALLLIWLAFCSLALANNPPPASSITPLPGTTPQTDVAGEPLPVNLGVIVKDSQGNPIAGTDVEFEIGCPSGSFAGGTNIGNATCYDDVTTDASGKAVAPKLNLNERPGVYQAVASTYGFCGGSACVANFSLTVVPNVPGLSLAPAALAFGNVAPGATSESQTVTATNVGYQPLIFSSMKAPLGFAESDDCSPSVAPGASCTITVTLAPYAPGPIAGALMLSDNVAGSPQYVALSGNPGTAPQISFSPPELAFFAPKLGDTTQAQTLKVQNTGLGQLAISGISTSDAFAETNNCGAALAPAASCAISATFTPKALGITSGKLTIAGGGGSLSVPLSGIVETAPAAPTPAPLAQFQPAPVKDFGSWDLAAGSTGDGGPATAATFSQPMGTWVTPSGDVYVADGNSIRVIGTDGAIHTVVAGLNSPTGVAMDFQGNLLITATDGVHELTPSGALSLLDISPPLVHPYGDVAPDPNGGFFVADAFGETVDHIAPDGKATIVAGTAGSEGFSGDGGPGTQAQLDSPVGVALDSKGDLYIASWGNQVLRKVDAGGTITTVAGNGQQGCSGDGGPALSATVAPAGIAINPAGELWIADEHCGELRKVDTSGNITSVADEFFIWDVSLAPNGDIYASLAPTFDLDFIPNTPIKFTLDNGGKIEKLGQSAGAVPFSATDSPGTTKTETISNGGDDPLSLLGFTFPAGFAAGTGSKIECQAGAQLTPGTSCGLDIKLTSPPDEGGNQSVTVQDNAGSPQPISLSAAQPPSITINFAPQGSGQSAQPGNPFAAFSVLVTDSVTGKPLPGQPILFEAPSSGASGTFASTGSYWANAVSDANGVATAPTFVANSTAGAYAIAVSSWNDDYNPASINLVNGSPSADLSPYSLSFGSEFLGNAAGARAVTLNNSGNAPLLITSIAASGDFSQTNSCGASLPANTSCQVQVTFTPTEIGDRAGSLTVIANSSPVKQTVALSGSGENLVLAPAAGSPASATVAAGSSAKYQISVTPQGGFAGSVTMSCAVQATGAGCSVSPASLSFSTAASQSVTVTVTTTAASAVPPLPPDSGSWPDPSAVALILLALAGLALAGTARRKRIRLCALWALLAFAAACGGGGGSGGGAGGSGGGASNPGTTAGSYTVTLIATAPAGHVSETLSLTVQ